LGSVTLHPIMFSIARSLTSGGRRQRLQRDSVLVVRPLDTYDRFSDQIVRDL
jgi:hypothetical protein